MLEIICVLSLLINTLLLFVILTRLEFLSEDVIIRFGLLNDLIDDVNAGLGHWRIIFLQMNNNKLDMIDAFVKCKAAEMVAEMQKKEETK